MPLLHTICAVDSTAEIRGRMKVVEGGRQLVLTSVDGERSYEVTREGEDAYSIVAMRRCSRTGQILEDGRRATTKADLQTFLEERRHYTAA
jgi:hypothetical protein